MKLLAVLAMTVLTMSATFLESPAYAAGAEDEPEYQLAILNAGKWVRENDVTIIRFRFLLNSIQERSGYPHRRIGDMVAKGRDLVRSNFGKEVSLLLFTEEANRAMRSSPKGTKFEEVVALLVVTIGRS